MSKPAKGGNVWPRVILLMLVAFGAGRCVRTVANCDGRAVGKKSDWPVCIR